MERKMAAVRASEVGTDDSFSLGREPCGNGWGQKQVAGLG